MFLISRDKKLYILKLIFTEICKQKYTLCLYSCQHLEKILPKSDHGRLPSIVKNNHEHHLFHLLMLCYWMSFIFVLKVNKTNLFSKYRLKLIHLMCNCEVWDRIMEAADICVLLIKTKDLIFLWGQYISCIFFKFLTKQWKRICKQSCHQKRSF